MIFMDWIHIEPEIQAYTLTEKAALSMLNDGKNYFQIAAKMRISFESAKEIVFSIRRKESIRMARLTNTQRAAIFQAWKDGTSQTKLAEQYGVSNNTICKLIKKMNTAAPKLEDVENGIPNTPLTSSNAEEKSEIAESEKLPDFILDAVDNELNSVELDIEAHEERIADLQEELRTLEAKRKKLADWLEAHT